MDSSSRAGHGVPPKRWPPPPVVIFLAVCTLTASSLLGAVASIALYNFPSALEGVGTCQNLILISSPISFIFIGMYLLAARRNEPVGTLRPPIRPIHSACFIVMRVMLVFWIISTIASVATSLRTKICPGAVELCILPKIIAISSGAALLSSITLLIGLERCDMPFETPSALRIRPKVNCRVSAYDNVLERSVSRGDVYFEKLQHQRTLSESSAGFKPLISESRTKSKHAPQTSELVAVRSPSPALTIWPPVSQNKDSWSEAWKSLVQETRSKGLQPSPVFYSGNSNYSASSYSSTHVSSGRSPSGGQHHPSSSSPSSRPRTHQKSGSASPSSSITSSPRRSPLSTMRTIENPEVAICSDLRLFSMSSYPHPQQLRYRSGLRGRRPMPQTYALQQQALGTRPVFRTRPKTSSSQRSFVAEQPNFSSRPATSRSPRPIASKVVHNRAQSSGSGQGYRSIGSHAASIEAHTQKIVKSVRESVEQRRLLASMEENLRRQQAFDMGRSMTHSSPNIRRRVEMPAFPPTVSVRDVM